MKHFNNLLVILLVVSPLALFADNSAITNAFRYSEIVSPSITKTSVVEVPFSKESFSIPSFAVYNLSTNQFEPYLLSVTDKEISKTVQAVGYVGGVSSQYFINDNNYSTYLEFPLAGNVGRAEITYTFEKPITAMSMSLALDSNVAMPIKVSINAKVNSQDTVVLAPTTPTFWNINFPKTTSSVWHVAYDYVQPLRITEMKFNDLSQPQTTSRGLRFLAQPGQSYQIYFDADRYVQSTNSEAGDLFSSKGVVRLESTNFVSNPEYKPADSDNDGVSDFSDNCTSISNSDQMDGDGNGLGDACEDYDRDGIMNINDNCADLPNSAQTDTDADGMGDVCDSLDNRITERMPWLPWAGIGVAGVVLFGLFVLTLKHKMENDASGSSEAK